MGLWSWLRGKSSSGQEDGPGEGPTEANDARLVDEAVRKIQEGQLDAARALLLEVVGRTPHPYRNEFEQSGQLYIKFWDLTEFLHYTAWMQAGGRERKLVWILNAYPRACYYLGYLAIEARDYRGAVAYLDQGLALENNPKLKCEMAQALIHLGEQNKALALYDEVLRTPGYLSDNSRALSLRGRGYVLIDLGDLDGAEAAFRQSLELDPESGVARAELSYIEKLRGG